MGRDGRAGGSNTTSVKRMLDGTQSRWPVPRFVAKVLSRHLHREISVTECGFADRTPAFDDRYDGLQCSGTLDGTVRTVVELSGRDMDRHKFLLGSAFTAAAFSEPALFALTVPPTENTARVAGKRIGMPDVEIITENIAHLRRLDHRYGSGRVREQIVRLPHREAGTVIHGSYSEKTGKALLGAVAQASWLAGSMGADVGRHSLAQRYYTQTLNLAMSAGDRLYAANVLSRMSRLTVQIGHGAITDHDRPRHARQAIALARAGHSVTDGKATPVLSALLHVVEARGHALLGEANATGTAVPEVECRNDRSDRCAPTHGTSASWTSALPTCSPATALVETRTPPPDDQRYRLRRRPRLRHPHARPIPGNHRARGDADPRPCRVG
jgi:hypothetical protein